MKKQELEELLDQRNKDISQLHQRVYQLQEQLKQAQKEAEKQVHEAQQKEIQSRYEAWKSTNEPFLSKYMKEVMQKLSIELQCDYGGDVEVRLSYNGNLISESNDTVIERHNGLDE